MVAALQTPASRPSRSSGPPANWQLARNPRAQLEKGQCAYCKKRGHWKNKCPKKKKLGRDPLHKLQATISFQEEETYLDTQVQPPIKLLLTCPLSEEYLLYMTEQNPPETSYNPLWIRKTLPDRRIFLPQSLGHTHIKDLHDNTHLVGSRVHY
jgi:hypothetical protein